MSYFDDHEDYLTGFYISKHTYRKLWRIEKMSESKTKVVTGLVRFSYVNIFKQRQFSQDQDAKYSMCVLIPKTSTGDIKKIKEAVAAAVQDGIGSKWGGKKPSGLKLPLRDGDEERAGEAEEYTGMYFLNANSNRKPGIVDKDCNEILDPTEVYSGCWGRVSLNFYPYNSNGNKGVGVGLNNVQKIKEDEMLGGSAASAEDDFGDGTDEVDPLDV